MQMLLSAFNKVPTLMDVLCVLWGEADLLCDITLASGKIVTFVT